MTDLRWNLKIIALFSTAIWRMFFENPSALLNNIQEKLRQKGIISSSVVRRFEGFSSSKVSNSLSAGEPTQALRTFERLRPLSRLIFRAQKRSIKRQLALLDAHAISKSRIGDERVEDSPQEPIKAIYIVNNSVPYTQSGYTLRSHKLLQALRNRGLDVLGLTRLGYPIVIGSWPKATNDVVDGIEYARMVPWVYPATEEKRIEKAVRFVVQESIKRKTQILHTTTDFKNGLVVAEAARRLGIPWVYEVRGQLESTWLSKFPAELQEKYSTSEFYLKSANKEIEVMNSANGILVLSEVSRKNLISRGVDRSKIFVVPNAIEPSEIVTDFNKEQLRNELGLSLSQGDFIFGTVTSVVEYEGLDSAVRALQYLPENYKLLIVGDGVYKPNLENLVLSEGLSHRVIFVGRQPSKDAWKWYGVLDVFVVPRQDTRVCRVVTPIKTIMAQAMGIPVVASDLPALREIAGGAEFVEPNSPQDLASSIRLICEKQSGNETVKSSATPQTWESNATIVERCYRYALKRS